MVPEGEGNAIIGRAWAFDASLYRGKRHLPAKPVTYLRLLPVLARWR